MMGGAGPTTMMADRLYAGDYHPRAPSGQDPTSLIQPVHRSTMDLNHLYLLVRDVDRSVAFYRDYFGFDGPSEWQGETFVIRNADGFRSRSRSTRNRRHGRGVFTSDSCSTRPLTPAAFASGSPRRGIRIIEAYAEPAFVVFKCLDPDGERCRGRGGRTGAPTRLSPSGPAGVVSPTPMRPAADATEG